MAAAMFAFGGCAGEDDIDRTQPNRLPKAMFQDAWYVRTTIAGVPGTSAASFIGYTGNMEKIRWEIQEQWLYAYRAYEEIPGTDTTAKKNEDPANYKENPIAAFPILAHFDIQREYNAGTGEQTNVISENTSDRPWHERAYMRVDWASSRVDPISFDGVTGNSQFNASYFVQQHENDPDAMRVIDKDGKRVNFDKLETIANVEPSFWNDRINYFDMMGRFQLEPEKVKYDFGDGTVMDIPLCYFTMYGGKNHQTTSCGPTEVKVRTSFLRVGNRNYEPTTLRDREMGKFGFFRTERFTWDQKWGFTEEGRIYLANIYNIWEKAYEENADGTFKVGADGNYVKIPLEQRTPKAIVYHLNKDYPCEMVSTAHNVAHSWNLSFRRAVAVAKGLLKQTTGGIEQEMSGISKEQVPDMFKLNLNGWVQKTAGDDWSCNNLQRDESKVEALVGDLRYNFLYWINDRQITGPLGYGPSSADPETGEIVAGQAFIYGSALDEYANRALEIVRMLNGDLDINNVITGDYVKNYILGNKPVIDPAKIPAGAAKLKGAAIKNAFLTKNMQGKLAVIRQNGLEKSVLGASARRMDRIKDSALAENLLDDEIIKGLAPVMMPNTKIGPGDQLSDEVRRLLSPLNWASNEAKAFDRLRVDKAAQKNIWLAEFADDSIQGLAEEVWKKWGQGANKDYDAMWQYLRERIFQGVTEHEVGHTVGLRHNFSGSYDSINFSNDYWNLRSENLKERDPLNTNDALNFADLYQQGNMTPNQIKGKMREYQYSTIMDYGNKFNSDVHGIGKYDHAAILFGYTGNVEIFDSASQGAKIALRQRYSDCSSRYESIPNLAYSPILEQWHYSSIWNLLGKTQGLTTRRFVKYDAVKAQQDQARKQCEDFVAGGGTAAQFNQRQDGNRDLEVPYMFCSDEYVGSTVSCNRWDEGADPHEIVDNVVKSYKNYYFFNNFKRGRFGFNTYSVYTRAATRYFSYLTNVYQHWLFRVASYGLDDTTLENYWTVGTWNGFNLLNEVIAKPEYGTYCKGEGGTCNSNSNMWTNLDRNTQNPGANEMIIKEGDGRRRFSRFDYDSGYYYQNQVLEAGHFWEYLAALQALTASTGVFVGVETGTDFTSYLVPYYIVFEDELVKTFEGTITDNYKTYAPKIVNGKFTPVPTATLALNNGTTLDPATGLELQTAELDSAPVVDLDNWFTLKFYALLQGMAEFRSLYSLRFADRQQIFRVGSGDEITPGPGKDKLTCADPVGGHIYGTIFDPADPTSKGGAVEMINKCNAEVDAFSKLAASAPNSQPYFRARARMNDTIEWLNFMRGMYDIFGRNID